MKKYFLGVASGFAVSLTATAVPITILNPGFEADPIMGPSQLVMVSDTHIASWVVNTNPVEHNANMYPPHVGQSVELNGVGAGSISQNIVVPISGFVSVTFWCMANPNGPANQELVVGVLGSPSIQTSTAVTGNGWVQKTLVFENVIAGTYPLVFASNTGGNFGPLIDEISASVDIADGGSTLLALGAAVLGLERLRRSRKA